MGSALGGGKGGSSGSSSGSTDQIAGELQNLAGLETGTGMNIMGPGYQQYAAGATGQLTPAQQALVTQALGNMNLGTQANYANLGLGGSTMEQQDLNANRLSSLAQQAGLETQSEQLGLQALGEGLSFLNAGSGNLGGAGSIYNQDQTNKAGALTSLASGLGGAGGGTSGAGSTSGSGFGGLISQFLGGSGSGGGFVDNGTFC